MAKKKKADPKLYRSERTDIYFQRRYRRGTIPVLLVAAGAAAAFAYYNMKAGHGGMYYAVAAALVGLAIWQFFYTRRAVIPAKEVDERVAHLCREIDLENRALNATDMDIDDFEAQERYSLCGYTTMPINKTAPLLRADPTDQTGRSSHMQLSFFVLGEESVEAYSLVRSLLNLDEAQDNMTWRYGNIGEISLNEISAACAKESGSHETETRKFPVISIRSNNRRIRRTYAFQEDYRAAAEELVARIQEQKQCLKKGNE